MNHPVVTALLPVLIFIAVGYFSGKRGWISAAGVKDLSSLVFMVLTPALLFRTMGTVHVEQLDFQPVLVYLGGAAVIFAATLLLRGFNRRGAVLALAGTFRNTVMIGIPLVGLAFGEAGLVTLFTLVSVHALVLLTLATIVLELAVAREDAARGTHPDRHMAATVMLAVRNGIIHPVPLPIIAGLLFAQTGWVIPEVIDKPLQLLGAALSPLALLLVGVTLAYNAVGTHLRGALGLAVTKNLVHPLLVAGIGWALGMPALPLAVITLTAALPIGANVFLFSQRYQVAEEVVTAGVAVSTALALVTVPVVMFLVG